MNPRDIVLEQIRHHETASVPYTLAFEQDVYDRLDRHFGSDAWRGKLIPYIKSCGLEHLGPAAKSAVPALKAAAQDTDERVRQHAAHALEVIERDTPKGPQPPAGQPPARQRTPEGRRLI